MHGIEEFNKYFLIKIKLAVIGRLLDIVEFLERLCAKLMQSVRNDISNYREVYTVKDDKIMKITVLLIVAIGVLVVAAGVWR